MEAAEQRCTSCGRPGHNARTCGEEQWRPVTVPGYERYYEVSSFGRVRRLIASRGTWAGKILAAAVGGKGYRVVNLRRPGHVFGKNVHELVARAFLGEPPPGHEVDHIDMDRANSRLDNLRYLTRKQNNAGERKRCGNCGRLGHPSCGRHEPRGPYACGVCGVKAGHNRLTCPTLPRALGGAS